MERLDATTQEVNILTEAYYNKYAIAPTLIVTNMKECRTVSKLCGLYVYNVDSAEEEFIYVGTSASFMFPNAVIAKDQSLLDNILAKIDRPSTPFKGYTLALVGDKKFLHLDY